MSPTPSYPKRGPEIGFHIEVIYNYLLRYKTWNGKYTYPCIIGFDCKEPVSGKFQMQHDDIPFPMRKMPLIKCHSFRMPQITARSVCLPKSKYNGCVSNGTGLVAGSTGSLPSTKGVPVLIFQVL